MLRHGLSSVAVILLVAAPALADDLQPLPVTLPTPAIAPAHAALEQGISLQAKHKYGAALAAFRRAYALEPTPMSALHVGECEAALGHYDAAEQDWIALAGATIPDGSPPAFEEARASAKEQLAKLNKLGSVRVVIQPGDAIANITVDGAVYHAGETRRVEAGKHVVRVVQRNRNDVDTLLDVGEQEHTVATVVLSTSSTNYDSSLSSETEPRKPRTEPASQGLIAGGAALTVIGGISIFVGSIFFLLISGNGFRSSDSAPIWAVPLVGGALFVGGGIPMIVVGNRPVPVGQPQTFAPPPPRTAALTFSF